MYTLRLKTSVNRSKRPVLLNVCKKDGTYLADKVVANGSIGFGISTYDTDDFNFNNNVFKVQSFIMGNQILVMNLKPIRLMICDTLMR
jgi:hypothetical protein